MKPTFNMKAPLLTIIIPTLNSGKTLRAALDSLLVQELQEWEAWVIDSVSKDDTLVILEEYARRESKVRYISEQDKGIYDAMNKGIQVARGEWLYFLGSDDKFVDERVLSDVAEELRGDRSDFVYGNIIGEGFNGPYAGLFDNDKLLTMNVSHQAVFYRSDLFRRLGPYDLRYKAYADWDFNLRCFRDAAIRKKYLDRIIAEYGPGGFSSVHDALFLREVLFPANLRMLEEKGVAYLRPIRRYDTCWRLIRNAQIRKTQEVDLLTTDQKVSACMAKMIAWQGRIPQGMLSVGAFSKFFMLISYLNYRLTSSI